MTNARIQRGQRLPSLDGLRAISIACVICAHLASSGSAPILRLLWRFDLGNLGVRVFFVISGFLITSILLDDEERRGRIGLGRFYLRRFFRIGPAYYVFLAAMAIAGALGAAHVRGFDFVPALTYTSNYFFPSLVLGHTWSLSVEEQFYLLWPGALFLLGRRHAFKVALAILVIAPFVRWFGASHPELLGNPRYSFPAVADALACGCLLAAVRDRLWAFEPYRRLLESPFFLVIPLAALILQMAPPVVKEVALVSVINVLIALTIDRFVRLPETSIGKILNTGPMVFVGVLSYSLYLWQQPFLDPATAIAFPFNISLLFVAALASYFLVERPFLQLRLRIERRRDRKTAEAGLDFAPPLITSADSSQLVR